MTTARSIAANVIAEVCERGAYSNLALRTALQDAAIDDRRERAFATELTYGTLRRLRALDAAIRGAADRPIARMTEGARTAVRLGAYQLLELRVPPHAAVGETVALVSPRERGFVNAVLRRIAAHPPPAPVGDTDAAVGLRSGLSTWAVAELRRIVGDGDLAAAATAFGDRPPLSIRANACAGDVVALEAAFRSAGLEPRRGEVADDCLLVEGVAVEELPGADRGAFAVQDQASAFVATSVGARPGERVLDLCAGPGGKAAALACSVGETGAMIASDVHPSRARLVRATLRRLGARGSVLVHDARRPALVPASFDRVLADAPCSGIGSARRRPELLWRTERRSLSELARLQVAIAATGADLVRPGGLLVYSVCTFPRAETDAVCDALRRLRPEMVPVPIAGPDGVASRIRLWPHLHGTDGMFVAAFRRAGSGSIAGADRNGAGLPGAGDAPR